MEDSKRQTLKEGEYHVVIDATLEQGSLTYGELIIPGKSEKEVFLSTYVCHPSMANNELSGPAVTQALCKYIRSFKNKFYTYRIVFIPETIGSILYLSQNLEHMKSHVIAGYNISCVGDDLVYSYLPSRLGGTLSDRAAIHALNHSVDDYVEYSFLERGSDERQYCSPHVDLPIACVTRSKYGAYKEYHTSLDNLDFISAEGLDGAYQVFKKCIDIIENNKVYQVVTPCEPQLGKRGLYPTLSATQDKPDLLKNMMNFLAYADGKHDLLAIADIIGASIWDLYDIADTLLSAKLIIEIEK